MSGEVRSAVEEALENQPFGALQLRVVLLCALVQAFDGFDLGTIGMAAPTLAKAWGVPPPAFTAAFVMSSVGILFGALALLTGIVLYKPVQFSWLAFLFGGFHLTRVWHFVAMCGFLAFIPGHLIMVVLHGWANFYSMLSGWKREPEYQE